MWLNEHVNMAKGSPLHLLPPLPQPPLAQPPQPLSRQTPPYHHLTSIIPYLHGHTTMPSHLTTPPVCHLLGLLLLLLFKKKIHLC